MDAVIFDMDGVIVDSERYWYEETKTIFQAATAETVDTDAVFDEVTGMFIGDIYDHLADTYEMAVEKEEFLNMYHDRAETVYREKVALMEGFQDILAAVQETGVTLAIASSSPKQWIHWVVDRFDLDAFDLLVSAEDIDARSKPAPDIYLYAADQLGADPSRCVVVEDSHNGADAASAAGMAVIGYRAGENGGQDLSIADRIVENSVALRETLTGLIGQ